MAKVKSIRWANLFFVVLLVFPLTSLAIPKTGYQVGYGKTKGKAHEEAKKKIDGKWTCGEKGYAVSPFETEWTKSSSGWKVKISYACARR